MSPDGSETRSMESQIRREPTPAHPSENLIAGCLRRGWRRIAFIGTTKHAGKTTALNALVREAHRQGHSVGLCSIGLDGERLDTVIGVEKPSIVVKAGMIVATAERALEQSDAELEWLEATGIHSPLGEVVLARVLREGRVLFAGVRQRLHVAAILARFLHYGCTFHFVDGAFDRLAAAAPDLVDAAILAVGAVAGKTIPEITNHAQSVLHRFCLASVDTEVATHIARAVEQNAIGMLSVNGELTLLNRYATANGIRRHSKWRPDTQTLFVPGAVTDGLLSEFLEADGALEIVALHPVQVLASTAGLRQFYRRGNKLSVWKRLPIAAIAANPHHILGYDFPKSEFLQAMREVAGDIPVFDAWHESNGVSVVEGEMG